MESLGRKILRLIINIRIADYVRDCGALACFRNPGPLRVAMVLCAHDVCRIVEFNSSKIYDLLADADLQEL